MIKTDHTVFQRPAPFTNNAQTISHNSEMNELVLPENISAYKPQTIYLKLFHVISKNKSLMQVKLIAV